jgi:hypothetical protein
MKEEGKELSIKETEVLAARFLLVAWLTFSP